jgi:hypothetical protein
MTSTTVVRPTPADEDITADFPTIERFELDLGRCVAEAVVRILGVTVWRVRLRPISAELHLAAPGTTGSGSMSASLSARPAFTSAPLTKRFFLATAGRDDRITFTIADIPPADVGDTVEVDAQVFVGEDSWTVPVALRFVSSDAERVVLAFAGAAPQRFSDPLRRVFTRIDAAAHFSRWG